MVEYVGRDNTSLEQLPKKPEILGSYILPNIDYNTMVDKYINGVNTTEVVTPRNTTTTEFSNGVPTNPPKIVF